MEGWHLKSCFHDLMHTIYLGIGRDIVSNILADMIDCDALGPGTLEEKLRRLSLEMHQCFRREKFPGSIGTPKHLLISVHHHGFARQEPP